MIPIADLNQAAFWIFVTGLLGLGVTIITGPESDTAPAFGFGFFLGSVIALILLWGSIYITFGAKI